MSADRPFAGRKLTRAERKAAEERSARRASARAQALPPPDPATRVDNPLGPRPFGPRPAAQATAAPAARPPISATPARPAAGGRATAPATRRRTPAPTPARASAEGATPLWKSRLLGDVPGRGGQVAFFCGLLAVPAGIIVAVGSTGTERLGHSFDGWLLAAGALVAVLGGLAAWRGRRAIAVWPQRISVGVAALAVLAFGVGVMANPVVINGQVHLATSSTAQAYELAQQMRSDLYRISELDRLAGYGLADARAHVAEYPRAISELAEMNARYAALEAEPPSETFAAAIGALRNAALWEGKAMETKSQLVVETDAKLATDVDSFRNTAWTESLTAANALEAAAQEFGFSVATDQTGPHE